VDGRTARAERTRTAIVDALLSLLEDGDLQPTASRIAERAGISLRLIYHHFGDLESLFRAASTREAERLSVFAEPIDPSLPFDDRVDALVAQRMTLLEMVTPVRRAALLQEPFSEELRAARDAFQQIGCDQVRGLFAAELAALPDHRRAAAADAISTATLWGLWNDLRTMGRSPADAGAAVAAILRGVLRP
jgi:TetR/AcrR family transcriptional regulator of autoinduction and epiphytic fitness